MERRSTCSPSLPTVSLTSLEKEVLSLWVCDSAAYPPGLGNSLQTAQSDHPDEVSSPHPLAEIVGRHLTSEEEVRG
ncbi:hypothetical protein SAMD00023353_9000130 [Rosellinia necatrix]|uniref:Uncharacterized protein n=1 Tax=Rosellinia necatrix TaxID=77044 RepID=A0A1S8ABD7_ROSNE|nr:hypothetical protein SAMD00023353_9000130 [Rosellinia necatrix]